MGVLKFAETVKIRGFDTFSKCKSRGGGYRISYGSRLKLYGRRCLCEVTYVTLKDTAPVIRNQWGERIQNVSFRPVTRLLNVRGTNQTSETNYSLGVLKQGNCFRIL
jgi:hypothetical protein